MWAVVVQRGGERERREENSPSCAVTLGPDLCGQVGPLDLVVGQPGERRGGTWCWRHGQWCVVWVWPRQAGTSCGTLWAETADDGGGGRAGFRRWAPGCSGSMTPSVPSGGFPSAPAIPVGGGLVLVQAWSFPFPGPDYGWCQTWLPNVSREFSEKVTYIDTSVHSIVSRQRMVPKTGGVQW